MDDLTDAEMIEVLEKDNERLQKELAELRAFRAALKGHKHDVLLFGYLGLVEREQILASHTSNSAYEVACKLGSSDTFTVELMQMDAERDGLLERDTKWTGDWKRLLLTPKGKKRLQDMRVSVSPEVFAPAPKAKGDQPALFG